MPKKQIVQEPEEDYEIEEEELPKISKRTGKPVRKLTDLQKETLARGRELALKNKKDIGKISATIERKKVIKEETLKAREIRQTNLKETKHKVEQELEDTRSEYLDNMEPKKKDKKIKKKIIKYIESSDSDSSDGEVIIKKRSSKKSYKVENENFVNDNAVYNLKNKLLNDRLDEMAKLLMPQ